MKVKIDWETIRQRVNGVWVKGMLLEVVNYPTNRIMIPGRGAISRTEALNYYRQKISTVIPTINNLEKTQASLFED